MKDKKLKSIFVVIVILSLALGFVGEFNLNSFEKIKDPHDLKLNIVRPNITYSWLRNFKAEVYVYGTAMTLDSSNNIYIGGFTKHGNSDYSFSIVKYDNIGNKLLEISWGIAYAGYDAFKDLLVDADGNIYITGYRSSHGMGGSGWSETKYELIIAKFNSSGNLQWEKEWDGYDSSTDKGNGIAIDSSGYIYVVGNTGHGGRERDTQYDICLLKYNNTGDLQWVKTWGGSNNEYGNSIVIDSSDQIYIGGSNSSDILLIRYNNLGDQLWNKTWGGSGAEVATSLTIDQSENIYIAGYTYSFSNSSQPNMFYVKYAPDGSELSSNYLDSIGSDKCNGISLDSDGNIFLIGTKDYQMFLVKYNNTEDYQWSILWDNLGVGDVYGNSILIDNSNKIYLSGYIKLSSDSAYMFLMAGDSSTINIIPSYDIDFRMTITLSIKFTASLEYNPISKTYRNRDHEAIAIFELEGSGDTLIIQVTHQNSYIVQTKVITTNKKNQIAKDYILGNQDIIEVLNYKQEFFNFYLHIIYTYTACVSWSQVFCDESAIRTRDREKTSEIYDFAPAENSILSHNLTILIIVFGFACIYPIYNIRKKHKEKK